MPTPRRIGVALDPTRSGPQHHDTWLGVRRYAEERDWQVVPDPFALTHPVERYDGIITLAPPRNLQGGYSGPTVCTAPTESTRAISHVTPSHRRAGGMAARHLLSRAYTRLGAIGCHRRTPSTRQLEAFLATARLRATALSSIIVGSHTLTRGLTWNRFHDIVERWLDRLKFPVGIFAAERVGYQAAAVLDEMIDRGDGATVTRRIAPVGVVARRSTDRAFAYHPAVGAALDWIARHCHKPVRVAHVAEAVGLPPLKLRRLMRQVRRTTVAHEIARARLRRAMSLLESTDQPVATVASRAGYSSIHALGRAFREHLHTTASAYRAAARSGAPPEHSPIEHARRLLRHTDYSLPRIALLTGYRTLRRLDRAFCRHEGTTPAVWRSIHGQTKARRKNIPITYDVTVTFDDEG
ncbi:helix-turn-helix domain-containing protein [bacterium]|nr:helix-turn-helix domain-containing protein [bacterium]